MTASHESESDKMETKEEKREKEKNIAQDTKKKNRIVAFENRDSIKVRKDDNAMIVAGRIVDRLRQKPEAQIAAISSATMVALDAVAIAQRLLDKTFKITVEAKTLEQKNENGAVYRFTAVQFWVAL